MERGGGGEGAKSPVWIGLIASIFPIEQPLSEWSRWPGSPGSSLNISLVFPYNHPDNSCTLSGDRGDRSDHMETRRETQRRTISFNELNTNKDKGKSIEHFPLLVVLEDK